MAASAPCGSDSAIWMITSMRLRGSASSRSASINRIVRSCTQCATKSLV